MCGGPPVRIVRAWSVRWLTNSQLGPAEVRRGTERSIVPGHQVRRISPADAAWIASQLLTRSAPNFRFAWLIQDLTIAGDGRSALVNLLIDQFVMIELEDARSRWDGHRVQPERRDPPLLEPVPQQALTWVALELIDADEPGRSFSGSQFRLRLPNGAPRSGALGPAGSVRIDDLEAGLCSFELMELSREPPR